jgi:glucose 1-dehydrogenase
MDYYKGKWALVTGAGRVGRIGADIAEHLARHGANIYLHYRSAPDEAKQVRESVLKAGREHNIKVELVQGDFAKRADVERVFQNITPDIIVNNAAVFQGSGSSFDMALGAYLESEDTNWSANVKSAQLVTEAAVYKLKKAKKEGVVVYIGDAYIDRGGAYPKGLAAYTASKSYIPTILTHYAAAYGKEGIRFFGVLNGPITPPPGTPDDVVKKIQGEINHPAHKLEPWVGGKNVASTIDNMIRMHLANGTYVVVDGGRVWKAATEFD